MSLWAKELLEPFWRDSQVMSEICSFQTHQERRVFYLAYIFQFVPSVSTVTSTSPPTFIRKARSLVFRLCNIASYSSKWKNILECLLINWLEEDEFLATQILSKISAVWYLCTHVSGMWHQWEKAPTFKTVWLTYHHLP